MEITIDLKKFKGEFNLTLEYYIVLQMIFEEKNILELDGFLETSISSIVNRLEEELFIKILHKDEHCIEAELREKGDLLFNSKNNINFDEFWEVFPVQTPSGRILRAANKEARGKLTRDYEICKRKYISKVKHKDLHDEIVSIVKARVASKDYEYINNLETYINQCKWQQDIKYLTKQNAGFTKDI